MLDGGLVHHIQTLIDTFDRKSVDGFGVWCFCVGEGKNPVLQADLQATQHHTIIDSHGLGMNFVIRERENREFPDALMQNIASIPSIEFLRTDHHTVGPRTVTEVDTKSPTGCGDGGAGLIRFEGNGFGPFSVHPVGISTITMDQHLDR